jgi:hypothetical protein
MKLISLYFILLFSSILSNGQLGYFNSNPIWSMHSACAINTPSCIESKDYNYYIKGDSTFNTHTYKKLFIKGNGDFNWSHNPPAPPYCQGHSVFNDTINTYLFVRDTLSKIFIFINNIDTLLYDFNLLANDTLPKTFNNPNNDITVTSIDSIIVGSDYRKRFHLSSNSISQYLVEGVGHDRGFIEPLYVGFDCSYSLICFGLGDTAYYPFLGPTCNVILNTASDNLERLNIYLYPNPASELVNIKGNQFSFEECKIKFYDITGRLISVYRIDKNNIQFDISSLESGLYLYKIIVNNFPGQSGKFIKK